MRRHRYALIVLLAFVFWRSALAQTPFAPETGILVLRNGQLLEGEVTRAGDNYVISKGEGSEIWIKNDQVEAFCGSLLEAYEFKVRHLAGAGAKPHLKLGEWCLRHGLHAKCAEQIIAAMRLEPDNAEVKALERRLQLAVEAPAPMTPVASGAGVVSADALEKRLSSLPRGSVEKFGSVIQPILLNRCGLNQCHGPNGKSEFRLLRPPPGQVLTRRFTQRNLYATLPYLDSSNPDSSPLVILPQRRHGNSLTAVFDKQTESQLNDLLTWTRLTVASPQSAPAGAPRTIRSAQTTLSQTVAKSADTASETEVQVMRPPLEGPSANSPAAGQPTAAPRDRYDAEWFNRRFHPK